MAKRKTKVKAARKPVQLIECKETKKYPAARLEVGDSICVDKVRLKITAINSAGTDEFKILCEDGTEITVLRTDDLDIPS